MKIALPVALLLTATIPATAADVVPLNFIHGLPFVDVKIGAASERMLFDSGGRIGLSVALTTAAKSGSVKLLKSKYTFQDLKGQSFEVPELVAHRVRIGSTQLGKVNGHVHVKWGGGADTGPEAVLTRAREAGAIGLEAFTSHPLLFDYQRSTMTIFETGQAPKMAQSLPLAYGNEGPYVVVKSGGKSLKLVLDTGTPVNLLDQRALDCGDKCASPRLANPRDVNGKSLLAQDAEIADLGGAPFDGILGAPFFRSYRVLFDIKSKQLHLSPYQ
ncbi:hypothetical protein [Pseudoduganella sp. OTU4001]|uniref:hypothetical protein n=1 Tax=Pseudoduganella sp. OTU4001 TaxID=3043854 RepID=UPI00313C3A2E